MKFIINKLRGPRPRPYLLGGRLGRRPIRGPRGSINWTRWECKNHFDVFFLDDGNVGCSYPPEFDDEDYDIDMYLLVT